MSEEAEDLDRQLLHAWKAGDRLAAGQLVERHFVSLLRFFENKASDAAQDLVQNTLLECTRAVPAFQEQSTFRTFLFAVARKVLLRHYVRRGKSQQVDFSVTSVADLGPSPSSMVHHVHEQRALRLALRRIPLELQMMLELRFWEGMSSSDIGEVMERPAATVRSQLVRATGLLRKELATLRDHE